MPSAHIAAVTLLALCIAIGTAAAQVAPHKPGMKELGVDLTNAGTSVTERTAFLDKMTVEQRAKVRRDCVKLMAEPDGKDPQVVAFCRDIGQ